MRFALTTFDCLPVYSIRYFDIAAKRIMKFWTHLDFVYRWTDLYKKEQKHLENLFNLTNEVMIVKIYVKSNKFCVVL